MKNSSRTWLERENAAFAKSIPQGSIVLDAGAGGQPYRPLLSHCVYEAADFELVDKPYARSTYVCDLAAIPVADERFDAVLFNQVMEHLPDPRSVLKELNRVMKPGARAICTAPLYYEEHEAPYDFYRFTQFAWRHLMETTGFEIERLDWMEGYFGTLGYQLELASKSLPGWRESGAHGLGGIGTRLALVLAKRGSRTLANMFHSIDERVRYTSAGHPKNYIAIIRKPL